VTLLLVIAIFAFNVYFHENTRTHRTDDTIEAEEFLMQLITIGARILAIKHEGVDLSRPQFDRMLKVASERLASVRLQETLGIDAAETKHRFGFSP
jgi:hypothetical protein